MRITATIAAMLLAASTASAWADTDEDDNGDDDATEQTEDAASGAPGAQIDFGGRTIEVGLAGLMDRRNREDLEEITLTAGAMQSPGEYELLSGGYYRIDISSDGTQELAVEGPDFFRNIWINEVVVNDIEIRPMGGIDSIEFDAAGTARISFVAIRPGSYDFRIRGTTGDTQRAVFHVR